MGDLSPESPFVLVEEIFQKGGYKTTPCNYGNRHVSLYMAVYPERVLSKTVFTPDAAGVLANLTGELTSADGTPPVLMSLPDDSVVNIPVEDWPDLCPDESASEPEYDMDLNEWLEAQLRLPLVLEAEGYAYAGRFLLNSQPSIRYERRSRVSLVVIEFVAANPLLRQESHYSILDDGTLLLETQMTVISVSAGEPEAAPRAGTGGGG